MDDLREAEVHELGRAGGGETDVVGLQVAVHQDAESEQQNGRRNMARKSVLTGMKKANKSVSGVGRQDSTRVADELDILQTHASINTLS